MTYFWKVVGSDAYHWYTDCKINQYPAAGWTKGEKPPANREQCDQCKAKDKASGK